MSSSRRRSWLWMSSTEKMKSSQRFYLFLSLFLILASIAVLNLSYANSQIRSRVGERPLQLISKHEEEAAALGWPSVTPKEPEWPKPNVWVKYVRKGQRDYYASGDDPDDNAFSYSMHVQHMGWPISVLEVKTTMRKRHNTVLESFPAQGEPRPTIMLNGAIGTPLLFGVPLWCLLWGEVFGSRRAKMRSRRRRGLCVWCAYEIGDFEKCPECGASTSIPQQTF